MEGAVIPEGFCEEEVKPPGPVHEYVAPATLVAVKLKLLPSQTGPLLAAVTEQEQVLAVITALAFVDEGHSGFPAAEVAV